MERFSSWNLDTTALQRHVDSVKGHSCTGQQRCERHRGPSGIGKSDASGDMRSWRSEERSRQDSGNPQDRHSRPQSRHLNQEFGCSTPHDTGLERMLVRHMETWCETATQSAMFISMIVLLVDDGVDPPSGREPSLWSWTRRRISA